MAKCKCSHSKDSKKQPAKTAKYAKKKEEVSLLFKTLTLLRHVARCVCVIPNY